MDSSPRKRLTALQHDLLLAFVAREPRFFLTGGGALAGFYFGHRDTEDLDLFTRPEPGVDLVQAGHALADAAQAIGATLEIRTRYGDFHRYLVERGIEACVVDLVVDRAPAIDAEKAQFGTVRVDTMREIAANKLCTLIGRSEIKDLVDLQALLAAGVDLVQALGDAEKKDAGVDPATLAWILSELVIGPEARLPGGIDPAALDTFRQSLVKQLRAMAFNQARRP